jgi:four helix bundle protein
MKVKRYSELIAWQKSKKLAVLAYGMTNNFPKAEKFGITSQIRRAAVSISANIAEGYGRNTVKDYVRFLYISQGSLFELETLFAISSDLGFVNKRQFEKIEEDMREAESILSALIRSLNKIK